ncbi:cellulase family glycosylhydrolase [Mycobacterium sp. UM_Kg27]|uniref:cellulase family glycosylhydrolase n=1 Tax=Mycobacterium sp. UM_Kg27 TaxID=1545693 RepID=UPI0006975A84|nr:cellulase family glycosylhydrolase [Mycobacterium sp. UM_Kg27]
MTRQCSTKRNRRVAGLGTAAGAFLAFGVLPLASAPVAAAEGFEAVFEQVLAPFMDTTAGGLDWDAVFSPAAWDAFASATNWDGLLAGSAAASSSLESLLYPDVAALVQNWVYSPLYTGIDWLVGNPLMAPVIEVSNQISGVLGLGLMIGDGADGTAEHAAGGAGGWLFGDGGAGWDNSEVGGTGGAGGAAGFFGNGGAGGDGGEGGSGGVGGVGGWYMGVGGAGGAGGDGVNGGIGGAGGDGRGWMLGIGGAGGDGGDGTHLGGNGGDGGNGSIWFGGGGTGGDGGNGVYLGQGDLPALGGAGGLAGSLGAHGAVGHFGTLDGAPERAPAELGTAGNWIVDQDGRVVILQGVNQVYKSPPFSPGGNGFGDDDAAFLAANGFTAVRLGVYWSEIEPQPGVYNFAYLDSVKETIETLKAHGIVSVIDMHQDLYSEEIGGHGAPDWATIFNPADNDPTQPFPFAYALNPAQNQAWDAFWSNEKVDGAGLLNHYSRMWQVTADYLGGTPGVAGYEIMNEPWPGTSWLGSFLGNAHFDRETLTPFYDQVTSAIRSVDPNTTVYYEPNVLFGNATALTNLRPVDDDNSVFAFHDYCIFDALGGGSAFGCSLWDGMMMEGAQRFIDRYDVPAVVTEFGATHNTDTITSQLNSIDSHRFGWLYWGYTNEAGSLVHNTNLPPVGDNVDEAIVATLAQPYPQVIAGIPNSWSFSGGVFSFSYSTAMADGSGNFDAGSQTQISIPDVQFPNGYQVSVTGGQVVSADNAAVLVIGSNAGASTITVTVTRAVG